MKRSQIKQVSMEVTVGAFMLMILLALGFFTIVLSRENILQENYYYDVQFDNVQGLIEGDKVYVHGVDVGRVKKMRIKDPGVRLTLSLRKKLSIHEGYGISVESSSVLGGRYVSINPGPADAPLVAPDAVLAGKPIVDLIAELADGVKEIRSALGEGGGILTNTEKFVQNIRTISDDVVAGRGTIGRLFKEEVVYDNLKQITDDLRSIGDRLERGEGTLGRALKDDALYTNAVQIVADLRVASSNIANGQGTLGKLLSKDDQLYRDVADAAASIRNISQRIDRGEGTLGQLSKDSQLYDELKKAIADVRALVDDFRETSPVASFSSVILGSF